jgi:hypothetical protein
LDLILDDGHITETEFEGYLREAEDLGSQLIAFGKKVQRGFGSNVHRLLSIVIVNVVSEKWIVIFHDSCGTSNDENRQLWVTASFTARLVYSQRVTEVLRTQ